VLFKEFD